LTAIADLVLFLPKQSLFAREGCSTAVNSILHVRSFDNVAHDNSKGEFYCTNNGALFSNNISTSNETSCGKSLQWDRYDDVTCFTSKEYLI